MTDEEATDLLLHICEVYEMLADFSTLLDSAFNAQRPALPVNPASEKSPRETLQSEHVSLWLCSNKQTEQPEAF